jgi:hypothetical protein
LIRQGLVSFSASRRELPRAPAATRFVRFVRRFLRRLRWPIETGDGPLARAWSRFANCLGHRELPRLDYLAGGVAYRSTLPGAIVCAGVIYSDIEFPGGTVRYSLDDSEPTPTSPNYRRLTIRRAGD